MGFGISFGKKKKTLDSITNVDRTETGTQSGREATSGIQSSVSNTRGTTTNTSSGSSSTNQTTAQSGSTNTSTQATGSSSSFGSDVVAGVEGSIQNLLSGINESGEIIGAGVQGLMDFDSKQFVGDILSSAEARQQEQLDQSLGGLVDGIGGTPASNSMAALLAQRLVGDASANLAGIRGNAEAQAQGILQNNLGATASAIGSVNDLVPGLLTALKGGNVTTSQNQVGSETTNLTSDSSGTTNTNESSVSDTNQTTQQTQVLTQVIDQLLNSITNTIGTERVNATERKGGGGFSLGF